MRQCPAVLLASGWFLFAAPLSPDGKVDTARPLSEWKHERSFDTAKECEAYKEEEGDRMLRVIFVWAERENKPPQMNPNWQYAAPKAYGRCIPSDAVKVK